MKDYREDILKIEQAISEGILKGSLATALGAGVFGMGRLYGHREIDRALKPHFKVQMGNDYKSASIDPIHVEEAVREAYHVGLNDQRQKIIGNILTGVAATALPIGVSLLPKLFHHLKVSSPEFKDKLNSANIPESKHMLITNIMITKADKLYKKSLHRLTDEEFSNVLKVSKEDPDYRRI